jgi:TRAP-type uncharacterized transport system substrate-binding protein
MMSPVRLVRRLAGALALVALAFLLSPIGSRAEENAARPPFGIEAKRPVMQAACQYCPWGAVADLVKRILAPAYDVQICYSCSGVNAPRIVANRLHSPEITDRQYAEGTVFRPDAPIDFGVTQSERVRSAYEGSEEYKSEGPMKSLRVIARIEQPSFLMIATTKESGITDLRQVRERKQKITVLRGNGGAILDELLTYYGMPKADIIGWGGRFLEGNALYRNRNFDLMLGVGALANYPEGGMWYEMTQHKDLTFFPLPVELTEKLAAQFRGTPVELPFRYMRGVGDGPMPTVGMSGLSIYGREDLPDQFVRDVVQLLDEKHGMLKWGNQPFSYDPATVADGNGVPLHPVAAAYYKERGYLKAAQGLAEK